MEWLYECGSTQPQAKHQRFDGGLKKILEERTSSSQMTCQKLGYPLVIKHGVLENVPSLYSIGTLW